MNASTLGYRFVDVPAVLAGILESKTFCGVKCARAFVLEALEFVGSSAAPQLVSDWDEVRAALRFQLALLPVT